MGIRVFEFYTLATPLFAAVDLLVRSPVRAAGIEDPRWRAAYYAALGSCWVLCRWRPAVGQGLGTASDPARRA